MPWSISRLTLARARSAAMWPGYSPARTEPGCTQYPWANGSWGQGVFVGRAGRRVEQAGGDRGDALAGGDRLAPRLRDPRPAPARAGELAGDGRGGVGVVAQVRGPQHGVAEVSRATHGPQGGLERVDAVAGAPDLGRLLGLPRTAGDGFDLPGAAARTARSRPRTRRRPSCPGSVRPSSPPARGRRRPAATPDASCGWTRPIARPPRPRRGASGSARPRAASATRWRRGSRSGWLSVTSPVSSNRAQRSRRGGADVEARPRRRPVAVAVPGDVAP